MARAVGISQKTLYTFLSNAKDNSAEIEIQLIESAKATRDKKVKRTAVVDPTALLKRYARLMEMLCHDKDGCTKNVEKVIVPVCVSLVDKNIKIALNVDFGYKEKLVVEKNIGQK